MWIQTTRTHDDGRPVVAAFKLPWMDERVVFTANGKAQVADDVAERLVDERADIEPSGDASDSDADGDDEDTSDDEEDD